jgi:hypothetical protein
MTIEERPRYEFILYSLKQVLKSSQNPGRVVTLVHKEDWDKFSEAVRSNISQISFSHSRHF